jgi:phage gpG-like protein
MIPAITITLPPDTLAVLARVQAWPKALTRAVIKALNLENEITVGHIQRTRASGKGPFPVSEGKLGVDTHRYRGSLRRSLAVASGGSIVSAIGTNIAYAGAHEFGFSGPVKVPAHTRRRFGQFTTGGVAVFDPRTGRIKKSRKRVIELQTGSHQVKAHTRQLKIPARAPIQRGIADRLPAYSTALSNAIVAALSTPPAA